MLKDQMKENIVGQNPSFNIIWEAHHFFGELKATIFLSPGKNTGSCHALLQIFPTQGSNPGLPYRGQILYCLSHQGCPSFSCISLQIRNLAIAHNDPRLSLINQIETDNKERKSAKVTFKNSNSWKGSFAWNLIHSLREGLSRASKNLMSFPKGVKP